MNRTITISEELYERLEVAAHEKGLSTVEQYLEVLQDIDPKDEVSNRKEAIRQADQLREEMAVKYGLMSDSTDLIREDRER